MHGKFQIGIVLLAAGALIASVACGDDDDAGGATAAATTAAAKSATTAASGGSEAVKFAVTAKDFAFEPATLEMKAASKAEITLSNKGAAPHTFTVYRDKEFTQNVGATSGNVSAGASVSFTFSSAGAGANVYFRCDIHPTRMKGEIIVK